MLILGDFYPRSPCGERPLLILFLAFMPYDFYPRSPCGERRAGQMCFNALMWYFYPRSPCGERRQTVLQVHHFQRFLSTLSLRRATIIQEITVLTVAFLSTLSLRRATADYVEYNYNNKFLSTLSLRRATVSGFARLASCAHFYPRSPCGERHPKISDHPHNTNFYPRSPCGERRYTIRSFGQSIQFLSTLSLRRATFSAGRESDTEENFYPRSPCGERLPSGSKYSGCSAHFYPRSPCGERQADSVSKWTAT